MKRPWLQIPVQDKIELMKHYRGLGYSYRDAMYDFEDSLKKYEEGGQIEEPIQNPYVQQPASSTNVNITNRYITPELQRDFNAFEERKLIEKQELSKQLQSQDNESKYTVSGIRWTPNSRKKEMERRAENIVEQKYKPTSEIIGDYAFDVGMELLPALAPIAIIKRGRRVVQAGKNIATPTASIVSKADDVVKPIVSSVDDVNRGFKSKIDWSKWNKEIPNNKSLIEEYNSIEQAAKTKGTWMKNPDGSRFKGTPEQFVQQNSKNFKKAFPNPILDDDGLIQTNYHGSPEKFDEFKVNDKIGEIGNGIYTTTDKGYAKAFSESMKSGQMLPSKNANILELYQNSNNPQNYYKDYQKYVNEEIIKFNKKNRFIPRFTKTYKARDKELEIKLSETHSKLFKENKINRIQDGFDSFTVDHQTVVPFSNYPKSMIGNNGMFDMTNPNIYKGIIPPAAMIGASQLQEED